MEDTWKKLINYGDNGNYYNNGPVLLCYMATTLRMVTDVINDVLLEKKKN